MKPTENKTPDTRNEKLEKIDSESPRKKWEKIVISIIVCVVVGFVLYLLLWRTGFIKQFEDVRHFRAYISNFGGWGVVVFIISGVAMLLFIPNMVVWTVGYLCFHWWALLWCYLIVLIASSLFFFVGRFGGKKWAYWMFGKDEVDRSFAKIEGKDFKVLTVLYILPFTPDNILAIAAGATHIPFKKYFIMLCIVRAVSVSLCVLIASGVLGIVI